MHLKVSLCVIESSGVWLTAGGVVCWVESHGWCKIEGMAACEVSMLVCHTISYWKNAAQEKSAWLLPALL